MTLKLAKRIVSCAIIGTAVLSLVVTYDTNRANAALNKVRIHYISPAKVAVITKVDGITQKLQNQPFLYVTCSAISV